MALITGVAEPSSPESRLMLLVRQAGALTQAARKHRKALDGNNFYAAKLANRRADATNELNELSNRGDTTDLTRLVGVCFSSSATADERTRAGRDLTFQLRTTWKERTPEIAMDSGEELFPLTLLMQTRRGYLVTIARQMNGCYGRGWYDAAAVMMRRLLETSIIEAFEGQGSAGNAKNSKGDFLQLSDLIAAATREGTWSLSRNTRKHLPELRDLGHQSAHSRRFTAQKVDIDKMRMGCRVVIEEFLRIAGLLQSA